IGRRGAAIDLRRGVLRQRLARRQGAADQQGSGSGGRTGHLGPPEGGREACAGIVRHNGLFKTRLRKNEYPRQRAHFRSHENVLPTGPATRRGTHTAAKIHAVTGEYGPTGRFSPAPPRGPARARPQEAISSIPTTISRTSS